MTHEQEKQALAAYRKYLNLEDDDCVTVNDSLRSWLAAWEARGRASGQQGVEVQKFRDAIVAFDYFLVDQPEYAKAYKEWQKLFAVIDRLAAFNGPADHHLTEGEQKVMDKALFRSVQIRAAQPSDSVQWWIPANVKQDDGSHIQEFPRPPVWLLLQDGDGEPFKRYWTGGMISRSTGTRVVAYWPTPVPPPLP